MNDIADIEKQAALSFSEEAIQDCPFAAYDQLRDTSPVYLDPVTGHYVLTRYADVRSAIMKIKQFSNRVGFVGIRESDVSAEVEAMFERDGWPQREQMQNTDPPLHKERRTRVDRAFAIYEVQKIEPLMDELANQLIDDMIDEDEVDFVGRFAAPLTVGIIANQLSVDRGDISLFDFAKQVQRWSDLTIEHIDPMLTKEREIEITKELIEIQHFYFKNLERVRANPDESLLARLIETIQVDGEPDIPELLEVMKLLFVTGNETTRFALASGMKILIERPDLAEHLAAHPEDMPAFVEESLRLLSPVQTLFRRTTEDIELHGVKIPAGSRVEVRFGAANRDPAMFECPAEARLDRPNGNSHLAFGAGVHVCIGMQLARSELNVAFRAILKRLKNFRATRGEDSYVSNGVYLSYGFSKLWLGFDRR